MTPSFIVLAALGESVILGIVLIVSFISWIVNLVQGANKPKGKPGNRPRPNQGQSELERFLKEVVGGKPEPEPAKKRPSQPPKPARPVVEKKSKPQTQRPATPPRPAAADRPGARLAQTHLAATTMGDGVRNHVSSHLEPHNVDANVKRDVQSAVQRDIDDAVRRDIGSDRTTSASQRPIHPLIQVLRNPEGVRQAVMMAEILNRPKSIR